MRLPKARTFVRFALTPFVVWAIYLLKANVWFRLYPAVMVALALACFAVSLARTPLAEVFARKTGERLDASGVIYCRRVTWAWTAFLAGHFLVTLATVWMPYGVWAWYNGCIAYVLMGTLFAGEWLFRRRRCRG